VSIDGVADKLTTPANDTALSAVIEPEKLTGPKLRCVNVPAGVIEEPTVPASVKVPVWLITIGLSAGEIVLPVSNVNAAPVNEMPPAPVVVTAPVNLVVPVPAVWKIEAADTSPAVTLAAEEITKLLNGCVPPTA